MDPDNFPEESVSGNKLLPPSLLSVWMRPPQGSRQVCVAAGKKKTNVQTTTPYNIQIDIIDKIDNSIIQGVSAKT